MDGTPGTIEAEPLGVGGIVSAAFDLYRSQATKLWTIVAFIIVPVEAVVVILERIVLSGGISIARDGTIYTTDSTAVLLLAVIVFGFLAAIVTVGALSKCLLDAYTGHPSDWRHSLRFAGERIGSLAWLAVLSGVLLAIAYVLVVIPGIYLTVSWLVAVPVLMFEGIGGYAALRRSHELVKGRWWATFGALLVAIVCIVALSIVVGLILGGIASSNHISVILVVGGVSRIVSAIVTYPIVAAISAVIYVDLRRRKEHVSPEQLIGAGEPSSTSPSTLPDLGLS
jgi:hypothetical protein